MRRAGSAILILFAAPMVQGQWTVVESQTAANLRGVDNAGGGVVWVSGTSGAVLRTVDEGRSWRTCSIPPGAEKLDFRGIQASDANTAVVMSSGKGELSRVYKTTDGCLSWKLVFTNPDADGFWDAIRFGTSGFGLLIGDPVGGEFRMFVTRDRGTTWNKRDGAGIPAAANQSIFAASNTALFLNSRNFYFITGGAATAVIAGCEGCRGFSSTAPGLPAGESAGGFSLKSRVDGSRRLIVAVGGDYKLPDRMEGTAAIGIEDPPGKIAWHASDVPPHGYRSAVAFDAASRTWIAVGPNGTDVSNDDGRTWRALKPGAGEPQDADRNWNALSLPFAVGPGGRIGRLRAGTLRIK